jgi:hypothetical protein
LHSIQKHVVRHDEVRAFGDAEPLREDAALLERIELFDQAAWIEGNPRSNDANGVWIEDAGRDQVKGELSEVVDHGVASVVSALRAHDEIRLPGHEVDNFALAFVTPLTANNCYNRHPLSSRAASCPGRASGIIRAEGIAIC